MTDTENAAFEAWQFANSASFHLMMTYKYGDKYSSKIARDYLASAVAALDAVLDAPVTEGAPV